ncbi:MAG: NAD(P)H-dependent oxidoreductase [Bacteroidetes bacterium]|nr:NAD(P)H-dependent oxidoreductase [Bacteroidota bacterium]
MSATYGIDVIDYSERMKKILIIDGNPDKESLCAVLAESYAAGATSTGNEVNLLHLGELKFSPVLQYGYRKRTDMEPDLEHALQLLFDADHIVVVYPIWWATEPALLKGFVDRVFLPGKVFRDKPNSPFPEKLLTGKTARLIVTMDAPVWYNLLAYRDAGIVAFKTGILKFCGVKPVRVTKFGQVKYTSEAKRKQWIEKARQLGEAAM